MRRLIVNADDFGWSEAVTAGILQAHQGGILTSTTVMMNLPGAAAAIDRARREAPNLAVGVHLNLTEGEPAGAPRRSRRRSSTPRAGCTGARRSSSGPCGRRRRPWRRPSGNSRPRSSGPATAASWPSHLDSHKHVHLYPRLLPVVIGLAQEARPAGDADDGRVPARGPGEVSAGRVGPGGTVPPVDQRDRPQAVGPGGPGRGAAGGPGHDRLVLRRPGDRRHLGRVASSTCCGPPRKAPAN